MQLEAYLGISGTAFISWLFFFSKSSVRTAAFTYAETRSRACDAYIRHPFLELRVQLVARSGLPPVLGRPVTVKQQFILS